jgi:hypothetical protein
MHSDPVRFFKRTCKSQRFVCECERRIIHLYFAEGDGQNDHMSVVECVHGHQICVYVHVCVCIYTVCVCVCVCVCVWVCVGAKNPARTNRNRSISKQRFLFETGEKKRGEKTK